MKLTYTLIDPTKNLTLLVTTPVARAVQPQTAGWLLRRVPQAEQVAFLEPSDRAQARVQMMGGEFCGNAAMGVAAWLSRKDGVSRKLTLEVSGAAEPVACAVTPVQGGWIGTVSMPLPERIAAVALPLPDGELSLPVVFLPGICHVIAPAGAVSRGRAEEHLRRWAPLLGAEAAGLLLWDEAASSFTPLVYVKETDTAVWEQGCGSGSAALGAYLTAERQADQCLTLRQPGGSIAVATRWDGERLASLTITGTVSFSAEKTVDLVF